jgi:hypothetical protein
VYALHVYRAVNATLFTLTAYFPRDRRMVFTVKGSLPDFSAISADLQSLLSREARRQTNVQRAAAAPGNLAR